MDREKVNGCAKVKCYDLLRVVETLLYHICKVKGGGDSCSMAETDIS